jgi:hypothetical protein
MKKLVATTRLLFAIMLGLGTAQAAEWSKEVGEVATKAIGTYSLHVGALQNRDTSCGDGLGSQDAKNAEFAACVMYVLGAVDMLREWQKIDPVHALPVCVPRTVSAGGLIIAVQEHIKATAPWRHEQSDAATAVIAALAAKWPCGRRR